MRNFYASKGTWQTLYKILKRFMRSYGRKMSIGIMMSAITLVCGLALLGLSGWFITASSLAGLTVATALAFDVFIPSATIRFLALARTASRYGERLTTHDATLSVLADLRVQLFKGWAASKQAAGRLLKRPTQLLFRLTVDVDALDGLYLRVLVPITASLIVTVLAGIALGLWITPVLGAALVVWLVLIGLVVPVLVSLKAQRAARMKSYALESLRARSIDLIAGQTDLLMTNQIEKQCTLIMKADQFLSEADQKMNKLEVLLGFVQGLASTLLLAGTLLICAILTQSLVLGVPMVAFALLLVFAIFEPFIPIRRAAIEFGRILFAAKRLAPQLDEQPTTLLQSYDQLSDRQILKISQVSFAYPKTDRQILNNINLELYQGQRIALVGYSGSGKSTLLSLISKELVPDTGTVASTRFSILTQQTELFQDSLKGNLLLANPAATEQQLWDALENAGLADTVKQLPDGLNTWLGEGGLGFSKGQARRLALARLLLREAPLWLLDEPTEGLDAQTADDVLTRLLIKSEQKSLLIATHLQREAKLADIIFVIDNHKGNRLFYKNTVDYKFIYNQLKTQ